jgi:hypothetical protein
MTTAVYDSAVCEVARFASDIGDEWIIINQSYWYSADRYTAETAINAFCTARRIQYDER